MVMGGMQHNRRILGWELRQYPLPYVFNALIAPPNQIRADENQRFCIARPDAKDSGKYRSNHTLELARPHRESREGRRKPRRDIDLSGSQFEQSPPICRRNAAVRSSA